MIRLADVARIAALLGLAVLPQFAHADSWPPPTTSISSSTNGAYRVTIEPKPWGGAASQPGARKEAHARVEHFLAERFVLAWEQPLVNRLAPTDALIANDGAYLVTFDNWGSVGIGDDVVVIYRRGGELVRKLSLAEFLPPAYLRHLPNTVSSVWWGGKHRFVEHDTMLELQVVEPGSEAHSSADHVPIRIRLGDGEVLPPEGPAWIRAVARIEALEREREHAEPLQPSRVELQ